MRSILIRIAIWEIIFLIGKNNKLQKDLFIKNDALFNGTIPVLRKSDNSLFENNKLKNDKFKLVL